MVMHLSARIVTPEDIDSLNALVLSGHHQTESNYFETAFVEQVAGKRIVFLAFQDNVLAGYAHLNFFPQYAPFLRLNIPEIQDLFVHPDYRRQGVGEYLIQACEQVARERSSTDIGIGVGVSSKFGDAQRLYTRMGYRPDGAGVVFERIPVTEGDMRPIDDRLCLMLLKSL